MKIFHTENGKEKVYVQMNDIMYILHSDISIPAVIMEKTFGDIVIVTDENRFDFVNFDEPEVIKFFRNLEWVIDYNEYIQLSDEQLEERAMSIYDEMTEIANKYNNLSDEEKIKNQHLVNEFELKEYMFNYCGEIYAIKHGEKEMTLPYLENESDEKSKRKKKGFFGRFKNQK